MVKVFSVVSGVVVGVLKSASIKRGSEGVEEAPSVLSAFWSSVEPVTVVVALGSVAPAGVVISGELVMVEILGLFSTSFSIPAEAVVIVELLRTLVVIELLSSLSFLNFLDVFIAIEVSCSPF